MSSKEESSSAAEASSVVDSTAAAKNDASEADFLLFGSRPSHLFDDVRIAIDTLLTEEVASLPLLPRTLSPSQRRQQQQQQKPGGVGNLSGELPALTGEQKLISQLRKAYKKNLDLAEAYCSRNIFTIQYYNKTKRRKIIEHILEEEGNIVDESSNKTEGGKDGSKNNKRAFSHLPSVNYDPPTGDIPSTDELNSKNREILQTRQQIQHDKQQRVQLSRQLDRLTKATQQLKELRGALDKALESKNNEAGSSSSSLAMKELQESVAKAVEGHEELKVWNARAEEVIQLMDQIKDDREAGGGLLGSNRYVNNGSSKRVATREEDERERKLMLSEMGDETAALGKKEEIASLLNKIRS